MSRHCLGHHCLGQVAADKDEPTKRKALTTFHQEELLKKQARRPLVRSHMGGWGACC